jgi:hypothetical protein
MKPARYMIVLMTSVFAFSAMSLAQTVEVWKRADITLTSSKTYANPYLDVSITAVFTHPDGAKITLSGFWNGGAEWRVRFSPTKTGVWNYAVTCSDATNSGLHRTGTVDAVENTGVTDLDKNGFIKISDNRRYFTYDNGKPFFWLGDTHWQAPNYVAIKKCNYPACNCRNQFRHEVDDRLAKGFTVYQTYFDASETNGGMQELVEGTQWLEKGQKAFTKINPAFFTEKVDVMFDYLAENGMVIALGFGCNTSEPKFMTQEQLNNFAKYITARYASYPLVWITAQEITVDTNPEVNRYLQYVWNVLLII